MKKARKWVVAFFLSAMLVTMTAFHVQASDMMGPQAMQSDTGVMYMTGGVGIESRAKMDMDAGNYNLKVVVASTTGAYLADAMVTIKNASGKQIFKTMTDGPWLMVKLPAGSYRVTAAIDDRRETRKVSVSSRLKTVFFHWKP